VTKKYVERWDAGCDSRPLLEEADQTIAQLHTAVKTAQKLAATRLMENQRLRTGLRQLAHKAGEEFGGFHSIVTFAEDLLGAAAHEPLPCTFPACGHRDVTECAPIEPGLTLSPDGTQLGRWKPLSFDDSPRCHFGGSYGWCELEPGHDGPHRIPAKS